MRRLWVILKFLGALALVFLMLVWPGEAIASAQSAMRVWAYAVGPSLFPFLALLPSLTSPVARRAYEKVLGKIMRPLFCLPGSAAAAVFIGMLAGSPAGALAAARVGTGLRRGEAKRMGLMVSGVSPVFLMSGVGVAMFGSAELGLWLIGGQAAAQLLTGILLRNCFADEAEIVSPLDPAEDARPVRAAAMAVLQVCGYMVLFAVAAGMLSKLAGAVYGQWLLYILDMPSGLAAAAETSAHWALAAAVAGFGGLCIAAQNMAVLKDLGVKWREYLMAKGFSAALTALGVALRFRGAAPDAPAMAALIQAPAMELSTLGALLLLTPALFAIARSNPNS